MTTATDRRFFGPFAVIHALDLPSSSASDLYEGFYAGFYDTFTRDEDWDVDRYVQEARAIGGSVLELACGSGRIALALARAGIEVRGIDLAPDMLKVLAKRIAAEPPEVGERIHAEAADMTELQLDDRFGLVVLGATSLCLLHSAEQRERLFATVAEHLTDGGRFLFDMTITGPEQLRAQDDELLTLPAVSERFKRFTLLGRKWLPEDGMQLVNFYSEIVAADGATRRFLGCTAKAVLDRDAVVAELERSGLELLAQEPVLEPDDPSGDRIDLFTCARARPR
jgi:SAM-dependent methyltransferase